MHQPFSATFVINNQPLFQGGKTGKFIIKG
jgi:hypothetical protein